MDFVVDNSQHSTGSDILVFVEGINIFLHVDKNRKHIINEQVKVHKK